MEIFSSSASIVMKLHRNCSECSEIEPIQKTQSNSNWSDVWTCPESALKLHCHVKWQRIPIKPKLDWIESDQMISQWKTNLIHPTWSIPPDPSIHPPAEKEIGCKMLIRIRHGQSPPTENHLPSALSALHPPCICPASAAHPPSQLDPTSANQWINQLD